MSGVSLRCVVELWNWVHSVPDNSKFMQLDLDET